MEAVLFIGLPGAGKSTFYVEQFLWTHLRINLDMLRTRVREDRLLEFCVESRQKFVVDNTNPTVENRAKYIDAAKAKRFSIVGYYFIPDLDGCLKRNAGRSGKLRVPDVAIRNVADKMSKPSLDEGFDQLHFVRLDEQGFHINEFDADGF
jgi:predicted kinase